MNLYVVRHGQTPWNVEKKMQGSADIPLNEKGIEQAYETKNNLKGKKIDFIISSPLIRAKQTADIINEERNLPIIYDERLTERYYGEFEGVSKQTFDYNSFWAYEKNMKYEKAENIQDFFNRINEFVEDLKSNYNDESILIVCHAGVMKALECILNGMMPDEEIGPFLPKNASVLEYNVKTNIKRK